MPPLKRLLKEVHKRSLWQLLASYIVGAWLVLQIAETLTSLIGLPLWFGTSVIALLAFGLVLVLTTGLVQVIASYRSDPSRSDSGLRRLFSWKNALVTGLVAAAVLVAGTGGYMGLRAMGIGPMGSLLAKGVLDSGERIVLADFENLTEDSLLAAVVTEALRTDIAQSRELRLAEPEYLRDVLAQMEKSLGATLDEELAREVAVRRGLRAVIAGEVSAAGSGYVLAARLVAPETGQAMAGWRETAGDSTEIIPAIDRLSKRLRERIGEPLRSIQAAEPLGHYTTPSLEALRKYTQAMRILRDEEISVSSPRYRALLEEAVGLDSTFAMALAKLAIVYRSQSRLAMAGEALSRAFQLRDHLTDIERYYIEGLYYSVVALDRQKAIAAYRTLLDTYPDRLFWDVRNNLGLDLEIQRQYSAAEEVYRQAIAIDSTVHAGIYWTLFENQVTQGKLDQAEQTFEALATRYPDVPWLDYQRALLASSRGDYEGAEEFNRRYAQRNRDDSRRQAVAASLSARLAAVRGQLTTAERHLREALDICGRTRSVSTCFGYAADLSHVHLLRGRRERALSEIEAARTRFALDSLDPGDRPYLRMAEAYARAGDAVAARNQLESYEGLISTDTLYQTHVQIRNLGLVRGLLAQEEGRPEEAIRHFIRARENTYVPIALLPELGRAYELVGRPDSALAVYELYVTQPFLSRISTDARSLGTIYSRLASLYEMNRDAEKARIYHAKLIELWGDADSELQPGVEAARRAIDALSTDR